MKEANILVRASDGEAVVVDFGVAGAKDTLRATPGLLPPTTPPYRSPEAWRFFRQESCQPGEVYQAGPADDLYALGVVLYWLLTSRLPFTEVPDRMVDEVLHRVPKPPRQLNPRVPEALSAVCMKLLEKRPEDRYADAAAVEAAGQQLLATADAEWSVPLCTSHAADNVTTEWAGRPDEACGDIEVWLRRGRHDEDQPRRGEPHALAAPREVPAPEGLEPAPAPLGQIASTAPPAWPAAPVEAWATPLPRALPPPDETGGREPPSANVASRGLPLWLALAVLLTVGLGAGVNYLAVSARRTMLPATSSVEPETSPEADPLAAPLAIGWAGGGKVAPPWKAPEAGAGEFFALAAAAPPAAPDNGEPPVKSPQQKRSKVGALSKALGTGALCMIAACTSGPQVREEPPAEACPPGAAKAMAELGFDYERRSDLPDVTLIWPAEKARWISVKEGPTTWWMYGTRQLPTGTMLSGRLLFGTRVHARFTQARSPDGRTWPVCLELWRETEGRGITLKQGPTADDVKAFSDADVKPVEAFGK